MASEFQDVESPADPAPTQEHITNNKIIWVALLLALLIGTVMAALFIIPSDSDTTYRSGTEGESSGSSNAPPSYTTTTTITAEPIVSITTASTTPPMATTTNISAPPRRPMKPKTILCTFGITAGHGTVGPQDGVCDIIIFDFLYVDGKGTFINHNETGLRWFLSYVKNNTGTTEFGLGIDRSHANTATGHLDTTEGKLSFRDFWSLKIRHYGLLKFLVHDALVTSNTTATDYIDLFKKLQELQEVNRVGKFDEPGYLILGVGLYPPRTGAVYGYLRDILRAAPLDGVIIRTHLEDPPQTGGCKITGPNVYTNPFNTYEVSMVEAMDYVQSNIDQFRGRSLMASFSMSVLFAKPRVTTSYHGYQLGKDCDLIRISDIKEICDIDKKNYLGRLVPTQRVMLGFDRTGALTNTYDTADTIKWKICTSTKRYRTLQFGVALFNLEHEDGTGKCKQYGLSSFNRLAGYGRTREVSSYMRNGITDPDFLTTNPAC